MNITALIQQVTAYIDTVVGGNEFASGMVIGGIAGALTFFGRSIPIYLWAQLKKHVTTTLSFDSTHESFHLLMKYFFDKGLSDKFRAIKINNGRWGEGKQLKGMGYGSQFFMFNRRPIKIELKKEENGNTGSIIKEFLDITKIGRSHKLFDNLLQELNNTKDASKTVYYSWTDHHKEWICEQSKKSFDNIVMSTFNRDKLLTTINNFIEKEQWFLDYDIPYQLGILLYGPPGTGKTSLIRVIASYMNKDIVFVDDIEALIQASQRVNDAIIVVEELDTFGIANRNDDKPNSGLNSDNIKTTSLIDLIQAGDLGQIMTALDGIISNHGRIIIVTSNHIEKIDSAILRPGRIDLQLKLDYFDNQTFREMLVKFFDNIKLKNLTVIKKTSPAVVQNDIIMGMSLKNIINKYTK